MGQGPNGLAKFLGKLMRLVGGRRSGGKCEWPATCSLFVKSSVDSPVVSLRLFSRLYFVGQLASRGRWSRG